MILGYSGGRPAGAVPYPLGQIDDLLILELRSALGHFQIFIRVLNGFNEQALLRLARDDCRTAFAAFKQSLTRIHAQSALGGICVAIVTVRYQQWTNLRFEKFYPLTIRILRRDY